MTDFFISYQQTDLAWARWIDDILTSEGYSTRFQDRDFESGCNFIQEIDEALKNADAMMALLSPAYLESRWTRLEYYAALANDPNGGTLLPVRVDEVDASGLLAPFVYVDLVGMEEEQAKATLLGAVAKRKGDAPARPAPFPGTGSKVQAPFPSGPATISRIPFSRNPFFVGRKQTLARLHKGFTTETDERVIQALCGMGGVGKTQIAIEYAYRHRSDYGAVFWLSADSKVSLAEGMKFIAREVGMRLSAEEEADPQFLADAVFAWLAKATPWLLVFDNIENIQDVQTFIPDHQGGHILATSRLDVLDALGVVRPVEVTELQEKDGISFLLNRTQRESLDEMETAAVGEIVRELGGLPLGLEQAGSFILSTKAKFAKYLASFRRRRLDLIEQGAVVATPYKETVATTWQLNLTEVERESPAASKLLQLSAFLGPDAIPLWMIERAAQDDRFSFAGILEQMLLDPKDWQHSFTLGPELRQALQGVAEDPLQAYLVIEPLTRYSLVRMDASREFFSIHRVLQEVIRRSLSEADRQLWADRAVEAVNLALPGIEDRESTKLIEELLPHARAAIAHASDEGRTGEDLRSLLEKLGTYHHMRTELNLARPLLEENVKITESRFGPDHAAMAVPLHHLGALYKDIGAYPEAEKELRRSLTVAERNNIHKEVDAAKTQSVLGNLLADSGRARQAEHLLRQAVATMTAHLGPKHIDVGTSCQHLGVCLVYLKHFEEAHRLFMQSLGIYRTELTPDSPKIATALVNLGKTETDSERAEAHFEEARQIYAEAFGPDHPHVGFALAGIADCRFKAGDKDNTIRMMDQALSILEAFDHPQPLAIAELRLKLAAYYRTWGDLDKEWSNLKRVHPIQAKLLGPTHPNTCQVLFRIVDIGYTLMQYGAVFEYSADLVNALRIAKPGSSELGAALNYRATLLINMKRFTESRELYVEAVKILETLDGAPAGDLAAVRSNIADTYYREGRLEEAEKYYRSALDIFKSSAPDHPAHSPCLKRYEDIRRQKDRSGEADKPLT